MVNITTFSDESDIASILETSQPSAQLIKSCGNVFFSGSLEQIGWLFYLISPNSSSFTDPKHVPNYEVRIIPTVLLLFALEQLVRHLQHKRPTRTTDAIINFGAGLLFILARIFFLEIVLKLFYFLYDNYRILDLDKTSVSTWVLSLLLIEFVYYWVHRSLHEINIFWASHQFHHNAVYIDTSTTLRDTLIDLVIYQIFPIPLALLVPPPILLVHMQFSLIYQVWLHTEVINNLGPLEYIINTPRQHRIHHGKNPLYIDKNFGALLMIWDRLFGTYQTEEEEVFFGTTTEPYETYDTITLHFYYYFETVWYKFKQMEGFPNKMKALFYGPGWAPGKPRTGLLSDIPSVDPKAPLFRYDPYIPLWQNFYCMIHGFLITLFIYMVADHPLIRFTQTNALILFIYLLFALTSFGLIFDRRSFAPLVESSRCLLYFIFDAFIISSWIDSYQPLNLRGLTQSFLILIRIFHLLSIGVWVIVWKRGINIQRFYKIPLIKKDKFVEDVQITESVIVSSVGYTTLLVGSVLSIFVVFALTFDECTKLLV